MIVDAAMARGKRCQIWGWRTLSGRLTSHVQKQCVLLLARQLAELINELGKLVRFRKSRGDGGKFGTKKELAHAKTAPKFARALQVPAPPLARHALPHRSAARTHTQHALALAAPRTGCPGSVPDQRTRYNTVAPGRGLNAGTVCWVKAVPVASHTIVSTGNASFRVIASI